MQMDTKKIFLTRSSQTIDNLDKPYIQRNLKMKKIILFLGLILFSGAAFGQDILKKGYLIACGEDKVVIIESWWTHSIYLTNPSKRVHIPDIKLYKVRVVK